MRSHSEIEKASENEVAHQNCGGDRTVLRPEENKKNLLKMEKCSSPPRGVEGRVGGEYPEAAEQPGSRWGARGQGILGVAGKADANKSPASYCSGGEIE